MHMRGGSSGPPSGAETKAPEPCEFDRNPGAARSSSVGGANRGATDAGSIMGGPMQSVTVSEAASSRTRQLVERLRGAVIAGVLIGAGVALSSAELLDYCAAVGMPETKRHELKREDKHTQMLFVKLLVVAMLGLALSTAAYAKSPHNWRVAGTWIADALLAYGFRVVTYFYIVLPAGLALQDSNCGTPKAISGHTHFYAFHAVHTVYVALVDRPPLLLRYQAPDSVANTGDLKSVAWIANLSIRGFVALVVCFCSYAIYETYQHGFHSLRHMVFGAIAALLSAAVYLFARALALDAIGDVDPGAHEKVD